MCSSFSMTSRRMVVAAASEEGGIVTNGMSEFLRDGRNSNAAFLVSLTPDDFGSDDALAGVRLQRKIEGRAFEVGGRDYKAPSIRLDDFLMRKPSSSSFSVEPTYPRGVISASPDAYLPDYITESLRASISDFDAWMPGFYLPEATITGAETRSTSPVRILRDSGYESVSIRGIYPSGEGAGYSGGIVSSAADGIRTALALIAKKRGD